MPAEPGFEFFSHTADVGVEVRADSPADLFAHAARALVHTLVEDSRIEPVQTRAVELEAPSLETLLRSWLTEILVWFGTDRFLPGRFRFEKVELTALRGWVDGETFDPARHAHGTEVKGITRHQFKVEQKGGLWVARIIFDV